MIDQLLAALIGVRVTADIVHEAMNPSQGKIRQQRQQQAKARKLHQQQEQLNKEIKRKQKALKSYSEAISSALK